VSRVCEDSLRASVLISWDKQFVDGTDTLGNGDMRKHGIGITPHNSPKPRTGVGRAIMLPALKLSLDGFQLRDHPLVCRDPPDDECSITDALP
jgi:hypothetical protein